MSDDEFDDEPDLEEEFDVALEGDLDDDELVDDADVLDDELLDADLEVALDVGSTAIIEEEPEVVPEVVVDDDEEIIDLDEELHPDDVEEALDVVLRERTAKVGLEDEEDEEEEPDERGDPGTKIVPRRPGEFVCSSCFLVLPRHMLADKKRQLCSDCV